jgi:hypothetical protein
VDKLVIRDHSHASARARLAALALLSLVAACCPEPRSLDSGSASGNKGDGVVAAGSATLTVVQREILDRHCVRDCHEGGAAAASLQLARGHSWANLVNQRSRQIPTQIRVVPGNPGASYLVKKMEGGIGIVGDQMPRLAPARPASELELVRSWIARGAPND